MLPSPAGVARPPPGQLACSSGRPGPPAPPRPGSGPRAPCPSPGGSPPSPSVCGRLQAPLVGGQGREGGKQGKIGPHSTKRPPSSLSPTRDGRKALLRSPPSPSTLQGLFGQKQALAARFQLLPPGVQVGQSLLGLKQRGFQGILSRPSQNKDRPGQDVRGGEGARLSLIVFAVRPSICGLKVKLPPTVLVGARHPGPEGNDAR